jgi:hypothetical protein
MQTSHVLPRLIVDTALSAIPRQSIWAICTSSTPTAAFADFMLEIHGV